MTIRRAEDAFPLSEPLNTLRRVPLLALLLRLVPGVVCAPQVGGCIAAVAPAVLVPVVVVIVVLLLLTALGISVSGARR